MEERKETEKICALLVLLFRFPCVVRVYGPGVCISPDIRDMYTTSLGSLSALHVKLYSSKRERPPDLLPDAHAELLLFSIRENDQDYSLPQTPGRLLRTVQPYSGVSCLFLP